MLSVANPAATTYPQFYVAKNAWRIVKLFLPERDQINRLNRDRSCDESGLPDQIGQGRGLSRETESRSVGLHS
jgi:hypothetical protein